MTRWLDLSQEQVDAISAKNLATRIRRQDSNGRAIDTVTAKPAPKQAVNAVARALRDLRVHGCPESPPKPLESTPEKPSAPKTAPETRKQQRARYWRRKRNEKRTAVIDPNVRELLWQIERAGLPVAIPEYRFAEDQGRKWRFDLAWPDRLFAVEIDGMVHRIKKRFKADMEKHQNAFVRGWRVLRVSPTQARDGTALRLISVFLEKLGET